MSSTRLLVLGVVRLFQPVHGYDVRRELLSWRAGEWAQVAPGSIYNALQSLTRDGLLQIVDVEQVGQRPERTSYRLTLDGEAAFQQLLRTGWWTVTQPLDPLLPPLAFMFAMPRVELVAALRSRIDTVRGMQGHAAHSILALGSDKPAHVREMFRLMSARMGAEIAWAEALIERLADGEYATADEQPVLAPRAKPAAKPAKRKATKR